MNRCDSQMHVAALFVACCLGCGANSRNVSLPKNQPPAAPEVDTRIAEEWISKPQSDWPQIVLTNQAEFNGHTPLVGASGFLIRTENGRVLAATAAHLIGNAGGVEPKIPMNQLTPRIRSWKL